MIVSLCYHFACISDMFYFLQLTRELNKVQTSMPTAVFTVFIHSVSKLLKGHGGLCSEFICGIISEMM